MLHGRFAVIKLWPTLKTAEDECIARLKISAKSLGLECLEVDSFACLVDPPHQQITQDDVDFVLSLHFETPKRYDIFSFVALWNPLRFYHEWGYRKFTRHLMTHDDFLSCASPWADDQVRRLVASDPSRKPPELPLYHSLSEPILPPTTGEGKLFYAGINWERISGKPQRHGKLFKLLDKHGDLRIYGPKSFQGVDVWRGYRSYSGQVPFDGTSIVGLIHKAGISLVLSSEGHRESELMSSRLFESLAAGAVIISDENAFARRHFGNTLLYIDTRQDTETLYQELLNHLEWIRSNSEDATKLARGAQEIFLKNFRLDDCLKRIYDSLPARKQELECLYTPRRRDERVSVILLMPEFDPDILDRHLRSCLSQKNVSIRAVLAMDGRDLERFGGRVRSQLAGLRIPVEVKTLDYFERTQSGTIVSRWRLGRIILQAIEELIEDEYFCIVSPDSKLFSDHLPSLLRSLEDSGDAGVAWSEMLLSHTRDDSENADLDNEPGMHYYQSPREPAGLGRFLFRKSSLPQDLGAVLPYLDVLAMDLLFGISRSVPTKRCTLLTDTEARFNVQLAAGARPEEERELLQDYAPTVFSHSPGGARFSLDSLTDEEKTKLAVELAHSVPAPKFIKKICFGIYRFWLRRHNAHTSVE